MNENVTILMNAILKDKQIVITINEFDIPISKTKAKYFTINYLIQLVNNCSSICIPEDDVRLFKS